MSKPGRPSRGRTRRYVDRWAEGRTLLRATDPRMAELVDAKPELDPDVLFDGLPSDLWGALVLQVIGQQLSLASAAAILNRLEALHGGRMPVYGLVHGSRLGTLAARRKSRLEALS